MLYIAPEFREQVRAIAPSYISFEDASHGFESELKTDARRYDTPALAREVVAFSLAALDVLRGADMSAVLARGPGARRRSSPSGSRPTAAPSPRAGTRRS